MKTLQLIIFLGLSTTVFSQEYEWNTELIKNNRVKSVKIYNKSMYHRDSVVRDDEYLDMKYTFDTIGRLKNVFYNGENSPIPAYTIDCEYLYNNFGELVEEKCMYDSRLELSNRIYYNDYIVHYGNVTQKDTVLKRILIEKQDSQNKIVSSYRFRGFLGSIDISIFSFTNTDSTYIRTKKKYCCKANHDEIFDYEPNNINFEGIESLIDSCIFNCEIENEKIEYIYNIDSVLIKQYNHIKKSSVPNLGKYVIVYNLNKDGLVKTSSFGLVDNNTKETIYGGGYRYEYQYYE